MFNNNRALPAESEINPATSHSLSPDPAPSYGTTTYPPDKKDHSQAEQGIPAVPAPGGGDDSGSGFDPKGRVEGEVYDAVWGRIDANGPNYRNLGWYVYRPCFFFFLALPGSSFRSRNRDKGQILRGMAVDLSRGIANT